jgi:HTH-type transcriptional regulator / antitoxin HigA
MPRIIKTQEDYEAALARIRTLIASDPDMDTAEGDELELLTLLVQDYESKEFPIAVPDAVDAIQFRMEQQGLTPRDLIPYIGSRSKVSEVLSRKRPLSLSMMQALDSGLGIPAKVLLQGKDTAALRETDIQWDCFPLDEMVKLGWIEQPISYVRRHAEEVLRGFIADLGTAVLYRKTQHVRSARRMDEYALLAWTARVMTRALENPPRVDYKANTVNMDFMRKLASLSTSESGPLLARDFLGDHGISLVVERHLSRTYLDGAAILLHLERPVIGLTLRHDRIDNFWFTLMHELAHISLHLGAGVAKFYDDLDVDSKGDPREKEADDFAGEALIPHEKWVSSPASRARTPRAAELLAKELNIHPAIVAGRIRHHFRSYKVLNQAVGHGEVQKLFPEVKWD